MRMTLRSRAALWLPALNKKKDERLSSVNYQTNTKQIMTNKSPHFDW